MPTPLTIRQVAEAYHRDIDAWARTVGGVCFFARDPVEPFEIIAGMGPNDFRVVVSWAGDSEFGGNILQPLSRHKIEVWIARSRGLEANREKQLLAAQGDRPALLDLVEQAKERVRALQFPREITRRQTTYVSTAPVTTPDGISMAAYKITVTLDATNVPVTYRDATLS